MLVGVRTSTIYSELYAQLDIYSKVFVLRNVPQRAYGLVSWPWTILFLLLNYVPWSTRIMRTGVWRWQWPRKPPWVTIHKCRSRPRSHQLKNKGRSREKGVRYYTIMMTRCFFYYQHQFRPHGVSYSAGPTCIQCIFCSYGSCTYLLEYHAWVW